jgi:hypothetical protein
MMMKKLVAPNGRRHGLRARTALVGARGAKTVLTFESGAQVYHWTTDRPRARVVLKH